MPLEDFGEAGGRPLHPSTRQRVRAVRLGLSLDGWAVVAAIALAIIVRLGVAIPWEPKPKAAPSTAATRGATHEH
jgi:hypothetical protein